MWEPSSLSRIEPVPPSFEAFGVLTTGSLGKSLHYLIFKALAVGIENENVAYKIITRWKNYKIMCLILVILRCEASYYATEF